MFEVITLANTTGFYPQNVAYGDMAHLKRQTAYEGELTAGSLARDHRMNPSRDTTRTENCLRALAVRRLEVMRLVHRQAHHRTPHQVHQHQSAQHHAQAGAAQKHAHQLMQGFAPSEFVPCRSLNCEVTAALLRRKRLL